MQQYTPNGIRCCNLLHSAVNSGVILWLNLLNSAGKWLHIGVAYCCNWQSTLVHFAEFTVRTIKPSHHNTLCAYCWKCHGRAVKSTKFKLWCFWVWVQIPSRDTCVLETLNHCFVLRIRLKAVGPMCCVTHVKEPSALIEKRRGSPRCSWQWLLNAP